MSEFWVYNVTDMDFNVKFKGGRYRVEVGKTVNLSLATQGQLTVEQLEADAQVKHYIDRGFWVRVNGPQSSDNVALDEELIVAEVVSAATGRTDRSVIMQPTIDPANDAEPRDEWREPGQAEVHDGTTVVAAPSGPPVEPKEPSLLGMMQANTKSLPGSLAVYPPEDIQFAGGLTPDENMRLAGNIKKVEQVAADAAKGAAESAVLANRMDPSRCAAITSGGTQCRNKTEDKYCKTPKHAKMGQ